MKKRKSVNWNEIKEAYQRGEGSCRVLAERFGVKPHNVTDRCKRKKWRKEAAEIARKVSEKVIEKSVEKISSNLVDLQQSFILETIRRVNRYRADIDASRLQFGEDEQGRVIMDMLNIDTMGRAEIKAVEMGRQALDLPDAPQKVELGGNCQIEVIDPYAEDKGEPVI